MCPKHTTSESCDGLAKNLICLALEISARKDEQDCPTLRISRVRHKAIMALEALTKLVGLLLK